MEIFTLDDFPDLKVDCCITNDKSELIFISIWGRDIALYELLAKITLDTAGGNHLISRIKYNKDYYIQLRSNITYTKKIEKVKTSFGFLTQVFIFDERILKANPETKSRIILSKITDERPTAHYFSAIQEISTIPMLKSWSNEIISIVNQCEMMIEHNPIVGRYKATTITISEDKLAKEMSVRMRSGILTLEGI
ncbi:MAG: hypothetical protein M3Z63_00080 [Gilliamella apicola]|nr:hypothetical protein [Gilliamella apicola]